MKIITEESPSKYTVEEVINEATGKKDLYIKGIFMQAEAKNRNGRVYPVAILKREVNNYIKDYVDTGRALGELNHPPSVQVNPERASHLITEMWQEGNDFYGKAKILDTPMGKIVRGIIEGGGSLGVSSRGVGSLKESNGTKIVQDDFKLCCIDAVSDPSAHDAWVGGIYESLDYEWKDDQLVEVSKEEKKEEIEIVESSVKVDPKDAVTMVHSKSGKEVVVTKSAVKKQEKLGFEVVKESKDEDKTEAQVEAFESFMGKLTDL